MTPVKLNSLVAERYAEPTAAQFTKNGAFNLPPLSQNLSRKENSFLDLAVRLAESSDVDLKHGAVVVKNGRVLALGQNKWRNKDLKQADDQWEPILTTHAEMDALSRVPDAHGAVVYIGRIDDNGNRKFSRPCWRCMDALHKAGVKRVVYTTN